MTPGRDDAPPPIEAHPADGARTWRGFRLQGFQLQAIEAIRKGSNVLVSAPTGAGKTLIAEYAIADAVQRGRRCVYTAPIKALSNQKYRDFRDDPEVEVGLMTGDVTIQPHAQVLIMTTEILRNSIFEAPESLSEVDYLIFDEVHFLDDPERGTVWEESLIFAPPEVRILALSATVSNLDQLGGWMREIRTQELTVVRSTRRPVPLRFRLKTAQGAPFDLGRLPWVRKQEAKRGKNGKGGRGQGGQRGRRGRGGGRFEQRRRGMQPSDLAGLFDLLQEKDLLPTLCFSFSRRDCERLAERNQHRDLLNDEEHGRMAQLQEELLDLFQLKRGELSGEVFRLASRGVGFHHAGMLPIHKEIVERFFTSGLIKLLFTTETFALGINMPARAVVFSSLRKFDGISFDYLRTRDFMQMAGRAGRLGLDTEGLVVTFLDERDLKDAPMERIFSQKPEPILSRFRLSYSSILHLYERLGRERLHEAWEKSFNNFQHRGRSKKAREKNRTRQHAELDAHLAFLARLGYLDPEGGLKPRGRIARLLYGYEIQLAELYFEGFLEDLSPRALAVLFCGLVYEQRTRGPRVRVPARYFGNMRKAVDRRIDALRSEEIRDSIPNLMKAPDWGLSEAALAWYAGASFDEVAETTSATAGEVCRNFRQALQVAKQMRRTLDERDVLHERITTFVERMNRDEVDARHQLELG